MIHKHPYGRCNGALSALGIRVTVARPDVRVDRVQSTWLSYPRSNRSRRRGTRLRDIALLIVQHELSLAPGCAYSMPLAVRMVGMRIQHTVDQ